MEADQLGRLRDILAAARLVAAYVKDIFSKLPAPGPDSTFSFTGRNVFNFREENLKVEHIFGPNLSAFFK